MPLLRGGGDPAGPTFIDPAPLVRRGGLVWLGPAISALVLAAVLFRVRDLPLEPLALKLDVSPSFWVILLAYYLVVPVSEWIIFRRIWPLPAAGFVALLRKQICNGVLLGYVGEVYLYAWARRHTQVTTAPFGAIKDNAVLSALAGNGFTIALLVATAPFTSLLMVGHVAHRLPLALGVVLATSFAILFWRHRLFTLPWRDLRFITLAHLGRLIVTMVLGVMLWNRLVPDVGVFWWVALASLRVLLSRVPFLPDKDLAVAAFVSVAVAPAEDVVAGAAILAGLVLLIHLVLGALLGMSDLVDEYRIHAGETRRRGEA